jgi:3'(2'), 5'-bisphosphate nucleotidase
VQKTGSSADAVLLESVESGHTAHDLSSVVMAKLGVAAETQKARNVRMDSQTKYGRLAEGAGNVYLRLPRPGKIYQECIWDHAAGVIIVEEAGGCVTDVHGKPLDFSLGRKLVANTGVVATNGQLHASVLAALKEHM